MQEGDLDYEMTKRKQDLKHIQTHNQTAVKDHMYHIIVIVRFSFSTMSIRFEGYSLKLVCYVQFSL